MTTAQGWLCVRCAGTAKPLSLADGRVRPYCERHKPEKAVVWVKDERPESVRRMYVPYGNFRPCTATGISVYPVGYEEATKPIPTSGTNITVTLTENATLYGQNRYGNKLQARVYFPVGEPVKLFELAESTGLGFSPMYELHLVCD